MPILRILSAAPDADRDLVFDPDRMEISLGRDVGNDVVLSDSAVSRRHARLLDTSSGYLLVDSSTNGTRVGGEGIDRRILRHGDEIEIGPYRLLFLPDPVHTVVVPQPPSRDAQDTPQRRVGERQPRRPDPEPPGPAVPEASDIRRCGACGSANRPGVGFCTACGQALSVAAEAARGVPPTAPPVAPGARRHRPMVAFLAGLVIPGAGQAYNGQAVKGLFLLLASALVVPWLYSLYDAHARARQIAAGGGRFGRGGPLWIVLQGWLFFNALLLAAIALTLTGVLR